MKIGGFQFHGDGARGIIVFGGAVPHFVAQLGNVDADVVQPHIGAEGGFTGDLLVLAAGVDAAVVCAAGQVVQTVAIFAKIQHQLATA